MKIANVKKCYEELLKAWEACEWLMAEVETMAKGITCNVLAETIGLGNVERLIEEWEKEASCVNCHQVTKG